MGHFLIRDALKRVSRDGGHDRYQGSDGPGEGRVRRGLLCEVGFQVSASVPMLLFHLLKDIRKSLDAALKP